MSRCNETYWRDRVVIEAHMVEKGCSQRPVVRRWCDIPPYASSWCWRTRASVWSFLEDLQVPPSKSADCERQYQLDEALLEFELEQSRVDDEKIVLQESEFLQEMKVDYFTHYVVSEKPLNWIQRISWWS